jgi:UDP-N-acetylglucosamine 2-epimerase (non-hydrolysing)
MSEAKVMITDSGGIQEETTILGVPCLTIRENTERPVTITEGTNILVGTNPVRILSGYRDSLTRTRAQTRPKLWDGKAAERIVRILLESIFVAKSPPQL